MKIHNVKRFVSVLVILESWLVREEIDIQNELGDPLV
jgi:hypothetical protein